MRLIRLVFLLALTAPLPCIAAPATLSASPEKDRRDQVQAAINNAVDSLNDTLSLEKITPDMTVEDFLIKTKSTTRFVETLRRSQQIGGPRWVDGQTCQVRLEISGTRARAALVQIAASEGKKAPVTGDALALRLKDWDDRAFAATGSSTSAAAVDQANPETTDDVWACVPDDARRNALQAAKLDAVHRAIESVGGVELSKDVHLSDAMKDSAIRTQVEQWLQARPVTSIEFRQDRQVHVTMSATPDEFTDQLKKSLTDHGTKIEDAQSWSRIRDALTGKLSTAGAVQGAAGVDGAATSQPAKIALPQLPPAWANKSLAADGAAKFARTKLKTARAAEVDAAGNLLKQVRDLSLDPDLNIGQAVDRDPQFKASVEHALARAKTFNVDYAPDGSAKVKVALNLGDFWNDLQKPR